MTNSTSKPDGHELPDADEPGSSRAARRGLWLFAFYLLFYAIFIGLAVVHPEAMGEPFGPANLAVVFSLALIGVALALSIVYVVLHAIDGSEPGRRR